jgi:hypothetical protein
MIALDEIKQIESLAPTPGMPCTEEERQADIEAGLKDAREGRTVTHEEFVKRHAAWWQDGLTLQTASSSRK